MIKSSTKIYLFTGLFFLILIGGIIVFLHINEGLNPEISVQEPSKSDTSPKEPWIVTINRQIAEIHQRLDEEQKNKSLNPSDKYELKKRLAFLLKEKGDHRAAEKYFLEFLSYQEEQSAAKVFTTLYTLADIYQLQARYKQAYTFSKRGISSLNLYSSKAFFTNYWVFDRYLRTSDFFIVLHHNQIGSLFHEQGLYQEAETLYMETLTVLTEYIDKMPKYDYREKRWDKTFIPSNTLNIDQAIFLKVNLLNLLGFLYTDICRFADAEKYFSEAINLNDLRSNIGAYYELRRRLSIVYLNQGRYSDCESLVSQRLQFAEKQRGRHHPSYAIALNDLARIRHDQGLYQEAENYYKDALSFGKVAMGNEHHWLAPILVGMAHLYRDQNRFDEAEVLLNTAYSIQMKAFEPEHPIICETLRNLAIVYRNQGRFHDAEKSLDSAIEILEKKFGLSDARIAHYLNELGTIKCRINLLGQAENDIERAISLLKKSGLVETIAMANCLEALAEIRIAQKNYFEANNILLRKVEIQKKLLVPEHKDILKTQKAINEVKSNLGYQKQ